MGVQLPVEILAESWLTVFLIWVKRLISLSDRSGLTGSAEGATSSSSCPVPRTLEPLVMFRRQGISPATAVIWAVRVISATSSDRVPATEKLLPSGLVPSKVTPAPAGRSGAAPEEVSWNWRVRLWMSPWTQGTRTGMPPG